MALPIVLGVGAALAAGGGIASGVSGVKKLKEAKETGEAAQKRQEQNVKLLKQKQDEATKSMDGLGYKEITILQSFEKFQDLWERIQNRPNFADIGHWDTSIPRVSLDEIQKAHIGAAALAGGLSGAAMGTAGGFAAAGATYAVVMAVGTASTGTAIATLSGAAATNATLAALGGGAIAAGGGGMALGTAVLGATTAGVGLLVGGFIFGIAGAAAASKADENYEKMLENERKIQKAMDYLIRLKVTADEYYFSLGKVERVYKKYLDKLEKTLYTKNDWNLFTTEEKKDAEILVLLVGLLYEMCKVKLVKQSASEDEVNEVNSTDVENSKKKADDFLKNLAA